MHQIRYRHFGIALVLSMLLVSPPTQAQTYKNLLSFVPPHDGVNPAAGFVRDAAGDLYGTTAYGGTTDHDVCFGRGCGTVFKLDSTGKLTTLYTFSGKADGSYPTGSLSLDAEGNLYGTTAEGGSHSVGTVFKVIPTGAETVLYSFTGQANGGFPEGGVIRDSAGNLYGTAEAGGKFSCSGAAAPCSK
jgi:uncharacterized repeat protein (TIGR03803 family)